LSACNSERERERERERKRERNRREKKQRRYSRNPKREKTAIKADLTNNRSRLQLSTALVERRGRPIHPVFDMTVNESDIAHI